MKRQILDASESPRELEALYRANPDGFAHSFADAFAENPESAILQVWHERLFHHEGGEQKVAASDSDWRLSSIVLPAALSLIAGTIAKLPDFFPALDAERFHTRSLGVIVIGALIAYFCIRRPSRNSLAGLFAAITIGAFFYLNGLPDQSTSQTVLLACVHMPFVLWSLLGVAFLRGAWRDLPGRMDYLRYNGELLIHSSIILLGGIVLTVLTFSLFQLIDLQIVDWYMSNVVLYGVIAAPIVATYIIDQIVGQRFKIAPLLAKIFTPLFLVTAVAYLIAMWLEQRSPFTNRDFLIAFNALLVLVLGLCVFSISERGPKAAMGIVDYMNIALVSVTLLIDLVALSAILFRFSSYGFTFNRLAVLGLNGLAFCHLAGILFLYVQFARNRAPFHALNTWIVAYLPIYTIWSIIVAVGFPLAHWLFR